MVATATPIEFIIIARIQFVNNNATKNISISNTGLSIKKLLLTKRSSFFLHSIFTTKFTTDLRYYLHILDY